MTRTYDVFISTRIPNAKFWIVRKFRVRADREFVAIGAALDLARLNYITGSIVQTEHVPTFKTRIVDGLEHFVYTQLPAVWRYLRPSKAEIVGGDVVGLRALLSRLGRKS